MTKRITPEWRKTSQGPEVTRRREEAAVRLSEFSKLSVQEKLKSIDVRFGKNVGAKKQRARYAQLLAEQKATK